MKITVLGATGRIAADARRLARTHINVDDLASFMLDQVSEPTWIRLSPLVASIPAKGGRPESIDEDEWHASVWAPREPSAKPSRSFRSRGACAPHHDELPARRDSVKEESRGR